jgi:pyruvate/2-oxoacid:ferredoxin oxidoreductase alpha subunit
MEKKYQFDPTKDTLSDALGISTERYEEINAAVVREVHSQAGSHSQNMENLMNELQPQSDAEILFIGWGYSSIFRQVHSNPLAGLMAMMKE